MSLMDHFSKFSLWQSRRGTKLDV